MTWSPPSPAFPPCSYCGTPLAVEPAAVHVMQMGERSSFPLCLRCVFVYAMRLSEGHAEALRMLEHMWKETKMRDHRRAGMSRVKKRT